MIEDVFGLMLADQYALIYKISLHGFFKGETLGRQLKEIDEQQVGSDSPLDVQLAKNVGKTAVHQAKQMYDQIQRMLQESVDGDPRIPTAERKHRPRPEDN